MEVHKRILMLTSLTDKPFNFCKKEKKTHKILSCQGERSLKATKNHLPVKVMSAENPSSSFDFRMFSAFGNYACWYRLCFEKLCLCMFVLYRLSIRSKKSQLKIIGLTWVIV